MGNSEDTLFVSLGHNCEPDFKIRKFDKRAQSFAFSYCQITDPFPFLQSLENLDLIKEGPWQVYKNNMVISSTTHIAFHTRDNFDLTNSDSFALALAELNSRQIHLIEKTKGLFSDASKRKVLIQMLPSEWPHADYLPGLFKALSSAVCGDFFVVLVCQKKDCKRIRHICCSLKANNVGVFAVRKLGNPTKANDAFGWYRVLRRFKNGSPLRYFYSNYPIVRWFLAPLIFVRRSCKR